MDASKPLKNARHESFATGVARGASYHAAWAETFSADKRISKKNALSVVGSRVAKHEDVKARIQHLRREAQKAVETASGSLPSAYTENDIVLLYMEISNVLQKCFEFSKAQGVAPAKLEKLRVILAAHLARQGKLDSRTTNVIEPNPQAEEFAIRINAYA